MLSRLAPITLVAPILAGLLVACSQAPAQSLKVPPGFHIETYSADVPSARALALGPAGTVFVGSNSAGKVYALTDADGDGKAEQVRVVAKGLTNPLGVAFHDGDLYVSAIDRILKLPAIESRLEDPPEPVVVVDDLPDESHHGGRFIAFGPDGKLYVAIGAPCNVCDRRGYALIMRMNPDGNDREVFAFGIRNSVGFDWHPASGELWFTDNGRDMMGDDIPDDELNHATKAGQHFGFPYCHQGAIPDPEYGDGKSCSDYVPPEAGLGAHVAALGMTFYTGKMFPPQYRGSILLAEHGSWNRTKKSGYQVVMVPISNGDAGEPQPFVSGFLEGQTTAGRPVDVLQLADGSVLISDDYNGAIYRVTYGEPAAIAGD